MIFLRAAGADEIHAELPGTDYDADVTVAVMACGASVVIHDDGHTTPEGFDFYAPEHGHKATCAACRAALA